MSDLVETRQNELKRKKICRFCLSQDDQELTNIYSRENRMKTAPLPLQVMACVSIEVFSNDNMPSYVCNDCRMVFDYCYRFKQMCKKADTCLRHYPITGSWTAEMEKPKLPPELRKPKKVPPTTLNSLQANQIKNVKTVIEKIEIDEESGDTFLTMVTEPQKADSAEQHLEIETEPQEVEKPKVHAKTTPGVSVAAQQTEKPSQKLLNKSAIRILNKEAQVTIEPRMTKPVLKRDNEGNVALVTQILDPSTGIVPPDPVETAEVIETNVYPCPHCERSFPLRQLLEIHMVNHTRERSFDCSVCDKSFFSKYDLQKHNLVHTGERPFKCVVCNKGFTRSTLLHRHEKTHTDIPKYICVFCEKAFISQEEMEKHTERHRKNRPFTCKICDKSFAFKQGLERHEVIHCRFQPFQCHYCDQSFSTPSKLSRHLTAHAGARPYPCKLCPKAYLLSHHLTRHLRSHKNGNGSYKCNNCDKTFSSRDDLVYHSAVHATQTLVCPLCKDVFEDITTVTNHVKQHAEGEAYACEFCDMIFMTSDRLLLHTNEEHAEDMVVYHEDDQANALADKKKIAKQIKSDMADNKEIDEAIEEFLIEEFSDSGSNVGRTDQDPSNIVVKEETDWQINESQIMAESSKFVIMEESVGNQMVEDSVDYKIEDDKNVREMDEPADEPPAKVTKVNERTQQVTKKVTTTAPLRHKVPLKLVQKGTATHSSSLSPNENKKPIQTTKLRSKTADIQTLLKPQPKTRQTSIQAALQCLPKSVSIKKVTPTTPPEKNESKGNLPMKKSPASPPKATKLLNTENTIKNFILKSTELKKSPQMAGRLLRQRSETSPTSKSEAKPDTATSPREMNKPLVKKPVANEKKPAAPKIVTTDREIVEMMIGDKRVKVQKITMSKAQAAAMAREGRIQMKEGTMILKKEPSLLKKTSKETN